ncbi:MAG TPA: VOC family protein [Stellaceae bacterium]|jgi:catechol 2,3-dioxygenase-like lactoylglutathione lyase family enzyme|nr:VOC family protein [Stellaceae bacterium]
MASGRPIISHVVIACFDVAAMFDYYTKTLGFSVSDRGKIRDVTELCFLTFDPEAEHHQIALTGGRKGQPGDGALVHVCFRLPSYAALQARHRALAAKGVAELTTMTHGSWLSVYSTDPEGNKIEFRYDLPWYVGQPFAQPVDLASSEDEIRRATIEHNRDNPRFQLMDEWRKTALAKLDAE